MTIPDPTLATPDGGHASRPALVVIAEDATWRFALPLAGTVTIGRIPECELQLGDPSASRKHAQIRIDAGRHFVVDLGSYNGTTLNGEPVTGERELRQGDQIGICSTALVFHGAERRSEPVAVDEATFHQRFAVELDRARRYRRPVTLVSIRFEHARARDAARAVVAAAVRSIDTVAIDGAAGLLVLVPEVSGEERGPMVSAIAGTVVGRQAQSGWAAFPDDGVDAAILLATARAAAAAAPVDGLLGAAGLARTLDLGAARIVIAEPATVRAFALIERLAPSELPVLILGETGVGKESAALAVHHYSHRAGSYKAINCAAIPENLVESELFGHEKGAFTGAVTARVGLFEAAVGGTVFLDEVGELSLTVQAKLLRVLDARVVTRVGSTSERAVDVRIVAATNRDVRAEVAAGRFREDLYYRLSGAVVTLPPLRERPRELPRLVRAFAAASAARLGREPLELSTAAMQVLAQHRWPGNIRELRNALDFAVAAADGDEIETWHLPASVIGDTPRPLAPTESTDSSAHRSPATFRPIAEELRALERKRMLQALRAAAGVQTRAAELLQMPRRTFVAKMREYGLHDDLERG